MTEEKLISFSIEGKFITNLAREKFYYDNNLKSAIELLKTCLVSDEMTEDEQMILILKILNGNAEIVGTYPNDDYGVSYLDEQDKQYDIIKHFEKITKENKKLKEKNDDYVKKLCFLNEHTSSFTKDELNEIYQNEYDETLFKSDKEPMHPLLDSYIKQSKIDQDPEITTPSYGWLSPTGEFTPIEWGEHNNWANEWLKKYHPNDDEVIIPNSDGKTRFYSIHATDILIYKYHFVLLHNPSLGVPEPTYDESYGLTNKQKEFLYDYYMERNMKDKANKFLNE